MQFGSVRRRCGCVLLAWMTTIAAGGCWWQRDSYTETMQKTMQNWKLDAELARLLNDRFSNNELALSIRPPKPTVLVQQPDPPAFTALFQGGEPLTEVIVIGSVGTESLSEFEKNAMATLAANQRAPGGEYEKQSTVEVDSLHGGRVQFELFTGTAARQVTPPGGAATTMNYHWLLYFTEEGQQKVMVAFIIPDSKYSETTPALQKSLESLALSSKFSSAQ